MPVGWMKPPRGAILRVGHPMARGLEAAYLFNEGTGSTLFDYSRNGRNGTIVGATWTSTERGPALNFVRASSQYVSVTALGPALPPTSFTMHCTFLPASTDSGGLFGVNRNVGAHGYASGLNYNSAGSSTEPNIFFSVVNDAGTMKYVSYGKAGNLPAGGWHAVTGVYDSGLGALSMWVDGVYRGTSTGVGTVSNAATDARIGCRLAATPAQFFNGDIANCFAWSRALSAAEVAQLHARPYDMFAR